MHKYVSLGRFFCKKARCHPTSEPRNKSHRREKGSAELPAFSATADACILPPFYTPGRQGGDRQYYTDFDTVIFLPFNLTTSFIPDIRKHFFKS